MRSWSTWFGSFAIAVTACRQSDAPRQVSSAKSANSGSDLAPSDSSAIEAVRACVPTPKLHAKQECGMRAASKAVPIVCADFAPEGSPDVDVLSILLMRDTYDFAKALGIPSMQTILDAGTPSADAAIQTYRDFEGP